MAIAHDAATESHTGALASVSQASFSWTHTGAASGVDGVLVFVVTMFSTADNITSVTYGGEDVPAVPGARAVDTLTELMSCKAFFLGSTTIPQGNQTVTVNRVNNTDEMYAVAITVTASVAGKIGAVHEAGIVLLEENGTLAEQNVTDGSPGTDSVRYAGMGSGLAAPPAAGANSTALQSIDMGAEVASTVVETTPGQGSRPVGFSSGTSDDRAAVHLAVKEVDGAGGPQTVSPDLIDQSGVLFEPEVNQAVTPGLIDQSGVTFAPTVVQTVAPSLIDQSGVTFEPTVAQEGGALTVAPELIDQSGVTFAPQVNQSLTPGLIDQSGATFDPQVGQQVTPGLIDQSGTTFAPTLTQSVAPGLIDQSGAVFAPAVFQTVTPSPIDQLGVVFDPVVSQAGGAQVVAPGLIDQGGVLFEPTLSQPPSLAVEPELIDQAGVVFAPDVAQQVRAAVIDNAGILFDPSIAQQVQAVLITQEGIVFAPSISGGVETQPGTAIVSDAERDSAFSDTSVGSATLTDTAP